MNMRKYFVIALVIFISISAFAQKNKNVQSELNSLKIKVSALETGQRSDSLEKIYLKNELTNYSNGYERQWTYFSFISGILIFVMGLAVPLLGFLSLNKSKEEIGKKIKEIEIYKKSTEEKIEAEIGKATAEIFSLKIDSLTNEGRLLRHVGYIYNRLSTEDTEEKFIYSCTGIRYLLESADRFTQVAVSSTDAESFEQSNHILFTIGEIYSTMIFDNEELPEEERFNVRKMIRDVTENFDLDFIHELKKLGKSLNLELKYIIEIEQLLQEINKS